MEKTITIQQTKKICGRIPDMQTSRSYILLEYVKNMQPEFMELFVKRAPHQVVDAMRQTVTNMIGTLLPQFLAVTVTTVAENLAQLMYSVLITGYMFRNAQYRLELQQSLEQVALPDTSSQVATNFGFLVVFMILIMAMLCLRYQLEEFISFEPIER